MGRNSVQSSNSETGPGPIARTLNSTSGLVLPRFGSCGVGFVSGVWTLSLPELEYLLMEVRLRLLSMPDEDVHYMDSVIGRLDPGFAKR